MVAAPPHAGATGRPAGGAQALLGDQASAARVLGPPSAHRPRQHLHGPRASPPVPQHGGAGGAGLAEVAALPFLVAAQGDGAGSLRFAARALPADPDVPPGDWLPELAERPFSAAPFAFRWPPDGALPFLVAGQAVARRHVVTAEVRHRRRPGPACPHWSGATSRGGTHRRGRGPPA